MNSETSYVVDCISEVGYIPLNISLNELEELVGAQRVLRFGLAFEQRLDILLENYLALEEYLLSIALRNAVFMDSHGRLTEARHNVNRHLTNLLSSAKLYTDHTSHALSRQFTKGSCQHKRYIKALSAEYDSSFAYRVMEALRGYAQHRGFPAHSISFSAKRDEPKPGETKNKHIVKFGLMPKVIREDGGFKAKVLGELEQAMGSTDQVDLMPLIRKYISCLSRIHNDARDSVSADLEAADTCVNGLFARMLALTGRRCTSARIRETTGSRTTLYGAVSSDWIQERTFYTEKNCSAKHLSNQYVSSL